jgi:5-methylcytosine-specific restriction endonuclease McrA
MSKIRRSEEAKDFISKPKGILSSKTLLLNQSYEPIGICSAKKAIILIFLDKAELVANKYGQLIKTPCSTYPLPGVIRIRKYFKPTLLRVPLTRRNIMRRDDFKCQYCGKKNLILTIDHVLPKSRGGEDSWENLVAACKHCNNVKGDSTPLEAGMPLLSVPRRPHFISFLKKYLDDIDNSWKPFLFME